MSTGGDWQRTHLRNNEERELINGWTDGRMDGQLREVRVERRQVETGNVLI